LLGADPTSFSSHGLPEQYTSDPTVLELLNRARKRIISNGIPSQDPGYSHEPNDDSDKYHRSSPPVPYPYYPSINSAPPPITEGVYYPPPPQATGENPGIGGAGGLGNLPPPEVARFIPCRYFPACRYGSSCIFAHPQQPYFQGSLPPPAQYGPPYDPMSAQPYAPNYYAPPPPSSFSSQNGVHHMAPLSPPFGQHPAHRHSPSEVVPQAPTHFGVNGIPPPPAFPPISPSTYSHPGQAPLPMSISPLPALPQQPVVPVPGQGPQSPMYNPATSPAPAFIQSDTTNQYSTLPQPTATSINFPALNSDSKLANPQPNGYGPGPTHSHREGGHSRRGSARRGSLAGRKPPCLFFPAGRCKNGYVS
jgi:hypothetical protein